MLLLFHGLGQTKARLAAALLFISFWAAFASSLSTCSFDDQEDYEDPNLHVMEFDVGEGPQTTKVYVEPEITTMYRLTDPPSNQKVKPEFKGFQAKFVNLSNETVIFSWEEYKGGRRHVMRRLGAWQATGTASFPTHNFVMTPENDEENILIRLTVQEYPQNIYYYDPYQIKENPEPPSFLDEKQQQMYTYWRQTLLFNEQYQAKTGRSYLANYLRQPPIHFMWPAEYFGQEHWVTSRETHFTQVPPEEKLQKITHMGKSRILRESDPRLLEEYRDTSTPYINMTLSVISVAPRVLEIPNFLSAAEVQHILDLAYKTELRTSTTGDGGAGDKETSQDLKTRTSRNTWVVREASPIIDTVYRRAADLQRMDEALLRRREADERPDIMGLGSLGEQLQLVHYGVNEEYTPHHDFGFARLEDNRQGARFSTLLLYLNEPEEGGETSFPRWANAETFKELKVKPEIGKAVLFYSQLPDGNFDDLSHHAAKPVIRGEKFLINLWVWDPIYDYY